MCEYSTSGQYYCKPLESDKQKIDSNNNKEKIIEKATVTKLFKWGLCQENCSYSTACLTSFAPTCITCKQKCKQ
jgi:hypothetical protein